MPSIRLHGTSMVEYIYGDTFNKPARIIESVYDMRWRLAPNGTIFRLAESKGRCTKNITTNVKEIMLCSNVDVDSIGVDNCLTTYIDSKYRNKLIHGSPRHFDRAIWGPDEVNMFNLTAFKRYRDNWLTLMGYIFPFIGFIGKDDDNGDYMIKLYIPEATSTLVTNKIGSLLKEIYSMYSEKNKGRLDLVPEPESRPMATTFISVTYRANRNGRSKATPIFDRWIRFAQILYRRGAIGFNNNCVPTGILTGTLNIQSKFYHALTEVTSIKAGEYNNCGVFYDNRRSMIISLKLLFDRLRKPYTLIEGMEDKKYTGSIYTGKEFPESMRSIYLPDKIYLGYPNPTLHDIGPDLFDITVDDDSILVDGIRVPLYD